MATSTVKKAPAKRVAARRRFPTKALPQGAGSQRVFRGEAFEIWRDEPQHRIIWFMGGMYRLPMPWIYYRISTKESAWCINHVVGCRWEITDATDKTCLFRLPLPNFTGLEAPCYGPFKNISIAAFNKMTQEAKVRMVISGFWESNFNRDYVNRMFSQVDLVKAWGIPHADPYSLLRHWESLDPADLWDQPWCPWGWSLDEMKTLLHYTGKTDPWVGPLGHGNCNPEGRYGNAGLNARITHPVCTRRPPRRDR